MREESTTDSFEEPAPPRRSVLRTVLFAALGIAIAGMLLRQQIDALFPAERGKAAARRTASYMDLKQADLVAQYAVFVVHFLEKHNLGFALPGDSKAEMADTIEQLVQDIDDPVLLRRAGIVTMWLNASPSHYENFVRAVELEQQDDPAAAKAEARVWAVLYSPEERAPRLTAQQWQRLEPVLGRIEVGHWYADLVRLRADELLDRPEKVRALRRSVYDTSYRRIVPLLVLGIFVLLAGGIGCVVLLVVLVLSATGRFPRVGIPIGLRIRPLWETIILYFVLMSVVPLAFQLVAGLVGWEASPARDLTRALSTQVLSACSVLWLATARPALDFSALGMRVRSWVANVFTGVAGYCAALPLLVAAAGALIGLQKLLPEAPPPTHPVEQIFGAEPSGGAIVALFVMAVVLAPLIEETLFRGVMQSALRQQFGAFGAITISALIFALAHPQGPLAVPALFVLGAVFATLREIRGSILPGMIAHAMNNGVVMTVLYLAMFR
jgi:membrane protease YdiL (CAAX protease family)